MLGRLFETRHDLRPIHTKRVYVRLRPSTDVDGRRRPSTRVYAAIEHMLKSVRVHTKRVYVRRRTSTRRTSTTDHAVLIIQRQATL